MSREFKFRAWDHTNERIVDFNSYKLEPRISVAISDFWFMCIDHGWEIMQFTGLKDKNDKEIYEGDILKIPESYDRDVKCDGWVDFITYKALEFKLSKSFHPYWTTLEVIGNIYENAELINKKVIDEK